MNERIDGSRAVSEITSDFKVDGHTVLLSA